MVDIIFVLKTSSTNRFIHNVGKNQIHNFEKKFHLNII